MSAGLASVLLAITEGNRWGWTSTRTLGLLAVGLVLLLLWIPAELRADEPLVDMRMMRLKGVWTTNLVAVLLGVGMYSSFILVPQLVQLPESTGFGFGATVTEAGLFLLPATLMMLVVGSLAGRLERRYGSKPPLIAGAVSAAASFLLLAFAHEERIDIYAAMALLGIGIGLAFAALANLIVDNVRQDQTGVATGMNTVMRTVGGAVGAQIAASLLSNNLSADGLPAERGFELAFLVGAAALIVAIGAAALIPGRRHRVTQESPLVATSGGD
jgi:MFS family permease